MKMLRDTIEVRRRYEEAYDDSPTASVYQSLEWLDVFTHLSYELIFVEIDNSTLIPFMCKGKGVLRRAFSLPLDTYGGAVSTVDSKVCFDEVVRTLNCSSARLVDFQGHTATPSDHTITVYTHLVDLVPSYDRIQKRFAKRTREALRQSQRRGIVVKKLEDSSLLPTFCSLCSGTARKYHNVSMGLVFMRAIFDSMIAKNMANFYLAWHGNQAIGANLVLRSKAAAHDWVIGYLDEFLHLRPVNALIDRAIRDETESGTQVFDLGATPNNESGMLRFKESFGAEKYAYRVHSKLGLFYRTGKKLKHETLSLIGRR